MNDDNRDDDRDDALLARLRADLDAFTGAPGPAPAVPMMTRTARPPRDHRPLITVAAAAATLALLVTGLVLIANRDVDTPERADAPTTTAASLDATSSTDDPIASVPEMPVPPTPDGWVVVEWGDVRFSVPSAMSPYDGACAVTEQHDRYLDLACNGSTITFEPGFPSDLPITGEHNGLTVTRPDPEVLGIREFDGAMVVRGLDARSTEALMESVGVSTAWRVANEPPPLVPDGWVTFVGDGFSFRYPNDWPGVELSGDEPDPDVCMIIRTVPAGVTVGRGTFEEVDDCARSIAPPSDGVRVFPIDASPTDPRPGDPMAHVVVEGAGATQWVIRVGFGLDGTIGRAILASIVVDGSEAVPAPTTVPPDGLFETIGALIDTPATGPMLCFGTLDSYPPQCGGGIGLAGWSWDLIDGEQRSDDTIWYDQGGVYVRGIYDAGSGEMTVLEARPSTDDDIARLVASVGFGEPDFSVPCPEPIGGWPDTPYDPTVWPGAAIERLDGYAGSWIDANQRVVTVKVTGDVAAAESAVRALYDGAVCVVRGEHTVAELSAIQGQLMALSSVQVLSSALTVDATGEWVEATIVAPHPELAASLDAQYGDGTVRLRSMLVPTR